MWIKLTELNQHSGILFNSFFFKQRTGEMKLLNYCSNSMYICFEYINWKYYFGKALFHKQQKIITIPLECFVLPKDIKWKDCDSVECWKLFTYTRIYHFKFSFFNFTFTSRFIPWSRVPNYAAFFTVHIFMTRLRNTDRLPVLPSYNMHCNLSLNKIMLLCDEYTRKNNGKWRK